MPTRRKRRVIEIPDDEVYETDAPRHHHACGMVLFAFVFAIIAMPIVVKLLGMQPPIEASPAKVAAASGDGGGILDTLLGLEQTLATAVTVVRDALIAVFGWITAALAWVIDGIAWVVGMLQRLPGAAQP